MGLRIGNGPAGHPLDSPLVRPQFNTLKHSGHVFVSKVSRAGWILLRLPLTLLLFLTIRLVRPWLLIRINPLFSSRFGHFAGNTELYLCERAAGINVPAVRYVDLWYFDGQIVNAHLAIMWRRCLHIWPAWLLGPVFKLNKLLPGGAIHEVGTNTQHDRDVLHLRERMPPLLRFTAEEERGGQAGLRAMGIPDGAEFVCLTTRDSAYLKTIAPDGNPDYYSYHDYRNVDVQNYVPAAEALAELGYFVIRMGAVVAVPLNSRHPRVIDYATNGTRSDFMDIYLGSKCRFWISNSTGIDAVPCMFRRPVVYVDHVPLGIVNTYDHKALITTKKHWLRGERRLMTLREIFESGAGYCVYAAQYADRGIDVIESTPEEIAAVVLEMEARLKGTWQTTEEDEELQRRFWEMYPIDGRDSCQNRPLHGKIRARFGSQFLRDHPEWLGERSRVRREVK